MMLTYFFTKGGAYTMDFIIRIVAVVGIAAGLISTAYLVISLPAVIVWKTYRKIRFKTPLTM